MRFFVQLFNADRPETSGDVVVFLLFETLLAFQVILFSWKWAAHFPSLSSSIHPTGIANYLNISFMFGGPASYLNAAVITLFVLLGYLKKGRFFYLLALAAMHLQYAARFSTGRIAHGSDFTGMALLIVALTTIFISKPEQRRKVAIGFVLFFMSLGYTSAAFSKLIASGIHWVNGGNLILWIHKKAVYFLAQNGSVNLNGLQQVVLHQRWLATGMLTFGLLTELSGFLLCLRKWRWIEASFLISLHLGIFVTLNIQFTFFLTFIVILGYPWADLFDFWLPKNSRSAANFYLEKIRLVA
jgi:hypothetical protein